MKYRLCVAWLVLSGLSGVASAEPGDARILAARDAATRGDAAVLSRLAEQPSSHVLEPYVQYWLLSNRIARLTEPVPAGSVSAFLRSNSGSWLAEKLRGEWVRRLGFEKRYAELDAEYGLLMQPDQAAQCYAIQANALGAEQARAALEAQWLSLLDVPDSCVQPMQELALLGRVGPEEIWQRFRRLVENKRFAAARTLVSLLPDSQQPAASSLNSALDNSGRFLISPAAQNPQGRGGRELVLAAIARQARSDVRDAAERWRSLEGNGFSAEERAYAWGQLGWLGAQGHLPEATAWFGRASATSMVPEQRAWRVRASLRAGDWAGVRQAIDAMPAEQREAADWSYWYGRALQAQNRPQEAQQYFLRNADGASFYGILATEALGRNYQWPSAAAPVTAQELGRVQQSADFRRAEALYRLDMRTEGMREWNWGIRGADDRYLLAAAEYARRLGLYDRAINTAERTKNEHDFGLRYLAPYYDVFAQEAQTQQLDLAWVYGLVRQESRFQPVARSGVGAQGLMQVMPATGKWIAGKQGWKGYEPGWLTRIDTNVKVGSAYLRHVLDTLSNHPVLASAAYNAGPGRARKWRDVRPLEGAVYAETIPFTETRDYVKKVMTNAELYATLLERRPASLGSRLGRIPAAGGSELALAADEP